MSIIPFDDRDGTIWLDGQMMPWREAKIHVLTHGLHYGSGVFEGERAYEGKIFKSKEHTSRLFQSAKLLGMDIPFSENEINAAKDAVLKASGLTNAYLRPIAWRGSEQMGIAARLTKTHVAIATWDWPSYFSPEMKEKGISLQTSSWRKPAPNTAPTQAKAAGLYMINTLSKHQAEENGFADALMLDYRGYAAEATAANLFRVKNGVIRTPAPDCFLNGITRQTIIALAQELGFPLEIDFITVEDLKTADEVFVTGTAAEVCAVGRIDDTTYAVGPITRTLRTAYENMVRGRPYTSVAA